MGTESGERLTTCGISHQRNHEVVVREVRSKGVFLVQDFDKHGITKAVVRVRPVITARETVRDTGGQQAKPEEWSKKRACGLLRRVLRHVAVSL